jgi:polyphosphate kinase
MQEDTSSLFSDPSLYINRELSWLEFNQRVLEEAQDPGGPLLERLKFLNHFRIMTKDRTGLFCDSFVT